MELVEATIGHPEPVILGFFILQYAKLRMFELYYNFLDKFCDVNKFEELEKDTDSLYLALAEEDLDERILRCKRAEWSEKRSKDCRDNFRADAKNNFFPRTCCSKHKNHGKREPGLFKEQFRCMCSKTYCCYDSKSQKFKLSSKGLNKHELKDSADYPMAKYRQVLEEAVNLKSTNRGFKSDVTK